MSLLKKSVFLLLAASLFSCNEDEEAKMSKSAAEYLGADKQMLMTGFAKSLSSVVEESQEARKLLKDEAVKQFDKNYDVLWENLKGMSVGNMTFREYLEMKTSAEFMDALENAVPNLNILFPENPFFNLSADSYDPSDAELPVVVSTDKINLLYFEGEFKDSVAKGQIPGFNLLVVNENSRVIVDKTPATRGSSRTWKFKDDEFDASKSDSETRTATVLSLFTVGSKALEAYKYFNDATPGSKSSIRLQRDYIYYGITPTNPTGTFNGNVSEYISYIEVNPRAFSKLSDQAGDPLLNTTETMQEKYPLQDADLIDRFWNKGAYDFRFEIYRSTRSYPTIVYVPAKPTDLWDLHMWQSDYQHSTWFRHSKYWYRIDPNKFTSKKFYLGTKVDMGKWNIAEESLERRVILWEEDVDATETTSFEYETSKAKSTKFNGDVKLEMGLGESNKVNGGVAVEANSSNSQKVKKTISVTRNLSSDHLGQFEIGFYDPIVEEWDPNSLKNGSIVSKITNTCKMKTYYHGYVEFGITAY